MVFTNQQQSSDTQNAEAIVLKPCNSFRDYFGFFKAITRTIGEVQTPYIP